MCSAADEPFRCLIAGSGTREQEQRDLAGTKRVDNVTFVDRLNAEDVSHLSATSHVQYLGLNDHPLATTIPSKVQGILAGARPIMGSMTGDAANVINRSGGWTSSPGDVDALVANLREVIAQVGVACYRVSGQRERSTQRSSPTTLPWRASRACSSRPHRGGVVADPRVVALRPEHIEQCVRLHRQAFPDFFLSQLGTRFLAEFYRAFRSAPDAARGVAVDGEGRVPGVVVGTTRPGGFFSRLLKQRWLALAWAYFELVLLRPSAIPRLLRAVRYRGAFHWTSVGRC